MERNPVRLTKSKIERLEPSGGPYRVWDTITNSLYVLVTQAGCKTLYLRYRARGSKKIQDFKIGRVGDLSLKDARTYAQQVRGEVAKGADPQSEHMTRLGHLGKIPTVAEVVDQYEARMAANNRKWPRETANRIRLLFPAWLQHPVDWITPERVDFAKARLKKTKSRYGRNYSAGTINRGLQYLRAALNLAKSRGWMQENPVSIAGKLVEPEQPRTRILKRDEETRLRTELLQHDEKLHDYLRPFIMFLLTTGLRRAEAQSLKRSDLDLAKRCLVVRGSNSKTGTQRTVWLTAEILDILEAWIVRAPGSIWVFPSPINNAAHIIEPKRKWDAMRTTAGITDVCLHDLRRTCGSRWLDAGLTMFDVSRLLGHRDIETTQRHYAHHDPEDLGRKIHALAG